MAGGGGGGGGSSSPPFTAFYLNAGVAVADLNGDGRADIVVARSYVTSLTPPYPGTIEVRLQNAGGTFAPAVQYAVGTDPLGISVADVNGDGRPDIVVANATSANISVLLQSGTQAGSFLAAQHFAVNATPNDVAVGDLDGDGRADIAVATEGTVKGAVVLLQSAGSTLSFATSRTLVTGSDAGSVAIGDLDRDGRNDVAVSSSGGAAVFLQSVTNGVFNAPLVVSTGLNPASVAIGDLNGDGYNDLVVGNYGATSNGVSATASVALQNSGAPGSFGAVRSLLMPDGVQQVVLARVFGNAQPDVVAISQLSSVATVTIMANPGNGILTVSGFLSGPRSAFAIAVGDTNGDGRPDLIANEALAIALQSASTPGTFGAFTTVP